MIKDRIFRVVFRIVGVILLLLGVRMMAEGVINYIDEHKQSDWPTTTAYVTNVKDEYHSGSRHRHSHIDYDITYVYEVDGAQYTGMIYNQSKPLSRGDAITVKYDPHSPESSTYILKPYLGALILFLAVGAVMVAAGFAMSGAPSLIRKIRGVEPEKEYLPPEEYDASRHLSKSPRSPARSMGIVGVILVVAMGCGIMIYTVKNPPEIQAVDSEQFKAVMEERGYAVTDSTKKLSEEWGTGSMLEQSFSYDDGSIRVDFCLMQTENHANRLYDGMTLPGFSGSVSENRGRGYEMRSVEGDEFYAAKIRVGDTVVYVSALSDYKDEALEIIEKIGYRKE